MKIAIIGAGNVGGNLGRALAGKGHEVRFGVRDPAKVADLVAACGERAQATDVASAAAFGEVVLLTVPWQVAVEVAGSLGDLGGGILVDCTNPIAWQGGIGMAPGLAGSSGAEKIAAASGARVVKAFSTHGAEFIVSPRLGDTVVDEYLCGDDADAKATVAGLVENIGLHPVDVGPLRYAAQLEHLAVLWVHLAVETDTGRDFAFKLLRA